MDADSRGSQLPLPTGTSFTQYTPLTNTHFVACPNCINPLHNLPNGGSFTIGSGSKVVVCTTNAGKSYLICSKSCGASLTRYSYFAKRRSRHSPARRRDPYMKDRFTQASITKSDMSEGFKAIADDIKFIEEGVLDDQRTYYPGGNRLLLDHTASPRDYEEVEERFMKAGDGVTYPKLPGEVHELLFPWEPANSFNGGSEY